jgi:hypothetical protein
MTGQPDALEAVAALGRAIGAHSIARDIRELRSDPSRMSARVLEARRLCGRLEQYLLEERRALGRTGDEARRHHGAIGTCLYVVDCVIKSIREQPPVSPEAVRAELEAERRKLIMRHKADLLAQLGQRIARATASKRELVAASISHADEVGRAAIRAWCGELQARVDRRISAHGGEIIDRACAACGDDVETILAPAFLGVSAIPNAFAFSIGAEPPPATSAWRALATLLESEQKVRARAFAEASTYLDALLERESVRAVAWYAHTFAESCAHLESSFGDALDHHAQSATVATARAREAMRRGRDAVAEAHERIDVWLVRVAELQRQLG